MKQFIRQFSIFLVLGLVFTEASRAQYVPTDEGSVVKFTIKNLGWNSDGVFSGLEGKIVFDPADVAKASFDVSVKAATVNTDNNMRDNHIRKEGYFDVEHYPTIKIVSTAVKAGKKEGEYEMAGKLTIKQTTKDVTIPFTAVRKGDGFLFQGEFRINRKDFGVGGNSTLSNEVVLHLSVQTKKG